MSGLTPVNIDDRVASKMDALIYAGRSCVTALPLLIFAQLTSMRRRSRAARSAHALRAAGMSALLAVLPACAPAPDATASSPPQPAAGVPSNVPASVRPDPGKRADMSEAANVPTREGACSSIAASPPMAARCSTPTC